MEEGKKEKLGEAGERGRESERKEREEGEERKEGTQFNIHKLRNRILLPSTNSTSLCSKGVGNPREPKAEAQVSMSLCSQQQHCKQLEGEPPGVQ